MPLRPRTLHLDLVRLMGPLGEVAVTSLRPDQICMGGMNLQHLRLCQQGHREISLVGMTNRNSVIDRHQLHSPLLQQLTAHLCTHHVWPSLNPLQFRRTALPTAELTMLCRPQDLRQALDQTGYQRAHLQVLRLRVARHLDRLGPSASVVTVSEPT